jgi:hypothetical protein
MPELQMSRTPVLLYTFATAMILSAFGIVLGMQVSLHSDILTNRKTGLVNQTYNRVVACLASTSPTQRTPAYVKSCYSKAEAATGVTVEHYGDGE